MAGRRIKLLGADWLLLCDGIMLAGWLKALPAEGENYQRLKKTVSQGTVHVVPFLYSLCTRSGENLVGKGA